MNKSLKDISTTDILSAFYDYCLIKAELVTLVPEDRVDVYAHYDNYAVSGFDPCETVNVEKVTVQLDDIDANGCAIKAGLNPCNLKELFVMQIDCEV